MFYILYVYYLFTEIDIGGEYFHHYLKSHYTTTIFVVLEHSHYNNTVITSVLNLSTFDYLSLFVRLINIA